MANRQLLVTLQPGQLGLITTEGADLTDPTGRSWKLMVMSTSSKTTQLIHKQMCECVSECPEFGLAHLGLSNPHKRESKAGFSGSHTPQRAEASLALPSRLRISFSI